MESAEVYRLRVAVATLSRIAKRNPADLAAAKAAAAARTEYTIEKVIEVARARLRGVPITLAERRRIIDAITQG